MSWLTRILPYVEQVAMWQQAVQAYQEKRFFGNVPPHNGLAQQIPIFMCSLDKCASEVFQFPKFKVAFTSYLGIEVINQQLKDGLMFFESKVNASDCRDGVSNTLVVGER